MSKCLILQPDSKKEIIASLVKLVILFGLSIWAFWPELTNLLSGLFRSSETAHVYAVPVAILMLLYCRRDTLAKNLTEGSLWGVVLLGTGIAICAVATWPFAFGYARYIAIVPVLGGVILVMFGWRILWFSMPMLILIMLSIPIGTRLYATLALRPEKYTIVVTATLLDQLPGISTMVKGIDLHFFSDQAKGIIGLGQSNRAARLFLSSAAIGVFVIFSQNRSLWRIAAASIAAIPILLFCNLFRFVCWGLLTIYTGVGPTSSLPRNTSTVCSLFVAYGLFVLVCACKLNLFVDIEEENQKVTP